MHNNLIHKSWAYFLASRFHPGLFFRPLLGSKSKQATLLGNFSVLRPEIIPYLLFLIAFCFGLFFSHFFIANFIKKFLIKSRWAIRSIAWFYRLIIFIWLLFNFIGLLIYWYGSQSFVYPCCSLCFSDHDLVVRLGPISCYVLFYS